MIFLAFFCDSVTLLDGLCLFKVLVRGKILTLEEVSFQVIRRIDRFRTHPLSGGTLSLFKKLSIQIHYLSHIVVKIVIYNLTLDSQFFSCIDQHEKRW